MFKKVLRFLERKYMELCMHHLAVLMADANMNDEYIKLPGFYPFNWGDLISGAKQDPLNQFHKAGSLKALLDKALAEQGYKMTAFNSKGNTYRLDLVELP